MIIVLVLVFVPFVVSILNIKLKDFRLGCFKLLRHKGRGWLYQGCPFYYSSWKLVNH
jgi:hypothetical protein